MTDSFARLDNLDGMLESPGDNVVALDPTERTRGARPAPDRFTSAVAKGFAAMPLLPRSKIPAGKWTKYREHPLSEAQAAAQDAGDQNVGIITGIPSGVFVLDLDGTDAESTARTNGWTDDTTYVVATGRGKHFYYLLPEFRVVSRPGKLAEKVDVKGDGGYVVGAGSIHPNGDRYEALDDRAVPIAAPEALLEALRPREREPRITLAAAAGSGEVEQLYAELLAAAEGTRNDEANRVAFRLGQLIAAGRVGRESVEQRLREICDEIGLEPAEVDSIVPRVIEEGEAKPRASDSGVTLDDFHAFMPSHNYIFAPSGEPWPASSVNARIPPVPLIDANGEPVVGEDKKPLRIPANRWLDQHRPVEQMVWAPGHPQVVRDRLVSDGGWIARAGCNVFNQYRPPVALQGEAAKAGPWLDHVRRVYADDAEHLLDWLAHRVQRPEEKINHALVLGGAQGIGKDTILEPVKAAIGPWNFAEVSPQNLLGRFNGFVKSVILRVSEARDLGDVDRFAFYDHTKTYTAAPPDVLRVDEKHLREYSAFNVCGVIITTNHKGDGLYLPEDDRRHYVAWSDLSREDFEPGYWQRLWRWYREGGVGHVAAYLAERDLSKFDAKAPPKKTDAFWDIVTANSAPEDAELEDALAKLQWPAAVTLADVAGQAEPAFAEWLKDRRNSRRVPHKLEGAGYRPARNPTAKSGRWKVDGKDVVIYARQGLSTRDAIMAAQDRAAGGPDRAPM